jgi:hypothetical protein
MQARSSSPVRALKSYLQQIMGVTYSYDTASCHLFTSIFASLIKGAPKIEDYTILQLA